MASIEMAPPAPPTDVIHLADYIEFRYFDSRPHLKNRRLPVAFVAYMAKRNNMALSEVAYNYTISEQEALAALWYYSLHQDEIDAQEEEEQRILDELYHLHNPK
jgi:uncharacterized protein (DUF433 family)